MTCKPSNNYGIYLTNIGHYKLSLVGMQLPQKYKDKLDLSSESPSTTFRAKVHLGLFIIFTMIKINMIILLRVTVVF